MKIDVTEDDIAAGHRKCAWSCPVVKALNRQTNLIWDVSLSLARGWMAFAATVKAPLPKHVSEKILAYDNGGTMGPFSFNINY